LENTGAYLYSASYPNGIKSSNLGKYLIFFYKQLKETSAMYRINFLPMSKNEPPQGTMG